METFSQPCAKRSKSLVEQLEEIMVESLLESNDIQPLGNESRFLVAPQKEELLFQVTLFLCLLWKFVAFKIRPWLLIYLQKL